LSCGGNARQYEDARADDGPDPQKGQVESAETTLQSEIGVIVCHGFLAKEIGHVCAPLVSVIVAYNGLSFSPPRASAAHR
jgi:hypothetical protein